MGSSTTFEGELRLSPRLTVEQLEALDKLTGDDPIALPGAHVPLVDERGHCQWVAKNWGRALGWDGGEKFYDYVPWLEYVCAWLALEGVKANGKIRWRGEDRADVGTIVVKDNEITARLEELVPRGRTRLATARGAFAKIQELDEGDGDDLARAREIAKAALEAIK